MRQRLWGWSFLFSGFNEICDGSVVKNLPAYAGDAHFDPWVGKMP